MWSPLASTSRRTICSRMAAGPCRRMSRQSARGDRSDVTYHVTLAKRPPRDQVNMPIYALGDDVPNLDPSAYVHPGAVIIGNVTVGPNASVWPGAVLRGDYGHIRVGARTSVQDGTVVHATAAAPTTIGDDCVIGHNAHLEGASSMTAC